MSSEDAGGAPVRTRRSRKWWPAIGATIGIVAGAVAYSFETPVYEASTSILITPQRVPEDIVRSTVTAALGERLNVISQQILSRTKLERIIQEFNLYEEELQRLIMEDVVEEMRGDISISIDAPTRGGEPTSFRTSFQSPDPRTAMRVTERLASLFVQENLEDRSLMAEQTSQFLESQAQEARRRLVEMEPYLELSQRAGRALPQPDLARYEVLQEHYRSLLRKQEETQMAADMELRQIGEQFKVIDGAEIPEQPIGPARLPFLLWGALGGVAASFLLMLLAARWRRRRSAAPQS